MTFGLFVTPTADGETYSLEPILRPPTEGVDFNLGFSDTPYCGTSSRLEQRVRIRRIKMAGEEFEATELYDCDGDGRIEIMAHHASSYEPDEWLMVQRIGAWYVTSKQGKGDGPFGYTIAPRSDLSQQGQALFEQSAPEAERLLSAHDITCMAAAYLRGEDGALPENRRLSLPPRIYSTGTAEHQATEETP